MMAQAHPEYIWWEGERRRWEDATVHVTDLAWSAVGAVFEGIRAYWNDDREELFVFRLPEHLKRLEQSSRIVRLPLKVSQTELTGIIIDLLQMNDVREDTYIRPLVYTSNASGKRNSPAEIEGALLVNTNAMPSHLTTGYVQHAKVSSWMRISDNVMPPRVKNISNYRNGQLATYEVREDGYDVAFMLNAQGKISEAPGACVMMVRDGKLITPDASSGILESITRDAILTLAREELGVEVQERTVDRTELYMADEVFTCGTAAEITPVVSVDKYTVGNGEAGAMTRQLEALFVGILRGNEERWSKWRTQVPVKASARV
ncbi:MAG: branched-chain amino acid transaminase [Thermomicrobiales bacterium]